MISLTSALQCGQSHLTHFHVWARELHVAVKMGDERAAAGVMQERVDRAVAPLDIDYVATRMRLEPSPVAVVIVAILVSAHCVILSR